MITQFSKGFYKNHAGHGAFKRAVLEGDCSEIATASLLSSTERPFDDAYVHASPPNIRAATAVYREPLAPYPEVDTTEFIEELQQVVDLAAMRDLPLDELPKDLPRGMREVSPYLQQIVGEERRPRYAEGMDYGSTKEDWEKIQMGMKMGMPEYGKEMRKIVTARDASAFVHGDHPLTPHFKLVDDIFAEGLEPIKPEVMQPGGASNVSDFAVYGKPFVYGLLGEALRVLGNLSFYWKWTVWYPRPEEVAPYYDMGYLKLAYPEGSPMHPSKNAMHSAAAQIAKWLLILLFGGSKVIKRISESIEEAATLLSDNIGYYRVLAGVHYASDHTCFEPVAKKLAETLITQVMGRR